SPTASAHETVLCAAIHVTKTADHTSAVSAGSSIGFTVTVSNTGAGTASGVTLTDSLPGGNAATPVTWVKGATGDPASFTLAGVAGSQTLTLAGQPISMASGASLSVHITASTTGTSCTTYNNTASVSTSNDGSDSASAHETVNCPHVTLTKTADHTSD